MTLLRLSGLLAATLFIGCSGANKQLTEKRLVRIDQNLQAIAETYEAQSQQIEQMRDRLALIEDRLEAQAMHRDTPTPARDATLPLVRLRPGDTPEAPANTQPPATITQNDVDALGGGVASNFDPPGERRSGRSRRRAVAPPANAANAGNIGVVPITATPRGVSVAPPSKSTDPISVYKQAYGLYKSGDSGAALTALGQFSQRFPKHGYTDNAIFWMGHCEYDQARYAPALKTFRRVIEEHPAGNMVPDALLMIGQTLKKLGRGADGRETLSRLVAMYPQTEAARRARVQLKAPSGRM